MYAFLLRKISTFSRQEMAQLQTQSITRETGFLSPTRFCIAWIMKRISLTIEIMREPNATEPKWYRISLLKLTKIGYPSLLLFLCKNNYKLSQIKSVIIDWKMSIYNWNKVYFKAQLYGSTYRVKNQAETAPAITICWQPMMNCTIHMNMKKFHHLEN